MKIVDIIEKMEAQLKWNEKIYNVEHNDYNRGLNEGACIVLRDWIKDLKELENERLQSKL